MTGRKTVTRTKSVRRPVKRPSITIRVLKFFLNSASALAFAAGEFIVRNPVFTGGATAFAVVFGFVAANALWYQPEAHNAVFFSTRPELVFKPTPRNALFGAGAKGGQAPSQPVANTAPVPDQTAGQLSLPEIISDDMLPALAPNADADIARLQLRLSALGIYKGPIDGFGGPQTRAAVERWRALEGKLNLPQTQNNQAAIRSGAPAAESAGRMDNIASVIARASPVPDEKPVPARAETALRPRAATVSLRPAENKTRSSAEKGPAGEQAPPVPITVQDIIRVQAGLKAFGNDAVPVTGQVDKATSDAVREFQKLFRLPVTGRIDATLIGKMREIGLIG